MNVSMTDVATTMRTRLLVEPAGCKGDAILGGLADTHTGTDAVRLPAINGAYEL